MSFPVLASTGRNEGLWGYGRPILFGNLLCVDFASVFKVHLLRIGRKHQRSLCFVECSSFPQMPFGHLKVCQMERSPSTAVHTANPQQCILLFRCRPSIPVQPCEALPFRPRKFLSIRCVKLLASDSGRLRFIRSFGPMMSARDHMCWSY